MAEKIDLQNFADHSDFRRLPKVGFEERASLAIAWWILGIFAGVLLLAFVALFVMMYKTQSDGDFEKISDLLKFLISSVVPLVTLAVGYYLGDKHRRRS